MSDSEASESIKAKIDKLVREKGLLNSRLGVVNRENTSRLNTRSHTSREVQLNAFRSRIAEIDREITNLKHRLSLARNRSIENLSVSSSDFQIKPTEKPKNFRGLESFIEMAKEHESLDVFARKPRLERSDVVVTSESLPTENTPPVSINTSAAATSSTMATSTQPTALVQVGNVASSTPKPLIRPSNLNLPPSNQFGNNNLPAPESAAITNAQAIFPPRTVGGYMRSTLRNLDLPPTYESAEERANRLERENEMRNEFDYNLMMQDRLGAAGGPQTGAIPKKLQKPSAFLKTNESLSKDAMSKISQMVQRFTPDDIFRDDDDGIPSLMRDQIEKVGKNLSQAEKENLWNETMNRLSRNNPNNDFIDDHVMPFSISREEYIQPQEDIEKKPESQKAKDTSWNETKNRFAKYMATPERMDGRLLRRKNSSFLDDGHDQNFYPQRTVRFDLPQQRQIKLDSPQGEYDDNFWDDMNRFVSNKAKTSKMKNHPNSLDSFDSMRAYASEDEEQVHVPQQNLQHSQAHTRRSDATFDIPNVQSYRSEREPYPQRSVRSANIQVPQYNQLEQVQYPQRTVRSYEPQRIPRNAQFYEPSPTRAYSYPQNESILNQTPPHNLSIRLRPPPQETEHTRNSFLRRLRSIPKFNGESFKDLKDFIDITETLYFSCVNGAEEQELFEHMILQLRGEARSLINRLDNFDWQLIKSTLLSHFAYLANKNVLSSQLENLHQERNESLTEYTERARKLLREKNAVYNDLTEEQRLEHNRLARRAFSKGISNSRLRDRMITRGASSLEDAIAFAIEAENDALTDIPRGELYCKFCRINGHRENECRRKENANSDIGKLASALRSMSNGFNRNRNNFRQNQRNFGSNNFGSSGSSNLGSNLDSNNNLNRNPAPNWSNRNGNNQNYNRNWNNNGNNNPNRNWNGNNGSNFNRNGNNNGNGNGNGNANGFNSQNNRGNWQPNQRQQRSNNFIRRARINAISRDIPNDDYSSDNYNSTGWSSEDWSNIFSNNVWSNDDWSSDDSSDYSTEN